MDVCECPVRRRYLAPLVKDETDARPAEDEDAAAKEAFEEEQRLMAKLVTCARACMSSVWAAVRRTRHVTASRDRVQVHGARGH